MPLLRYNLAPTLNGLIASAPAPSDANTTPWIVDDPTIDFDSLYAEFSTFIMGRKTYETFLSLAPNPLAGRDKESVVVFTRNPDKKREWGGDVTVVDGDVAEYVKRLKQEQGKKDIWLMGGGEVAGLLMRAGLVDTVEAAIMPAVAVTAGGGMNMFGEGTGGNEVDEGKGWWKLELEELERKETGILMTRYKVLYD
ncbi:2,5-diamino-6-ribosylamino-4(3H)-pyrimidinone 5'-phosphate reductase [Madurella fahalii]|uniref:2,5-diamino-6-ribosylamino-4(3H)-pyrimidinone 5'-phosphate reductase n=1 Tax=Madurella fahalii TaxID=1157608 RepID=A0ABQ0GGL6_9PEZI